MNMMEFEPRLDKAYQLLELYGVGFEGYNDSKMKSNVLLPGWMKDAYTSHGARSKLVNIGEPKAVLTTRDGPEKHSVPLKWVGEVPPSQSGHRRKRKTPKILYDLF